MIAAAFLQMTELVALTRALPSSSPSIFSPASTPADQIYRLALFVLSITGGIFVVVAGLLAYAVVKYRRGSSDDGREPVQIYGSNQVEIAWTVIPFLIVVVLFLTAARVIHGIQDAPMPPGGIEVTVVGHQYWWEFRYPQYGVITANELHVPVSDPARTTPTYLTLLSADTDHSFWVPELAGKTDLIPGQVNHTWIDPQRLGVYLGQCAQYCGMQHAHMLLRVYVEARSDFDRWIREQQQPAPDNPEVEAGQRVFETTACVNCHAIRGTIADGRFGPDLTHLMSRDTLAAGMLPNTPDNLARWLENPDSIKPGCQMPAMNLNPQDLPALVSYLETLR